MNGVSIIICCYNSSERLPRTLEHLANQKVFEKVQWEIVLVDNNSTDGTSKIAKDLWQSFGNVVELCIIQESIIGLSSARYKGLINSKYDIVLFCDDDNWLNEDYVQTVYDFFVLKPKIGAIGGRSIGVLEVKKPIWWQKEKTNYAVGRQAQFSGDISDRSYIWGSGLAIRKELLLRLFESGFTPLLSDRKANILSSGGDSELCKWVLIMGYKLWYLDTLVFHHFIPKSRLTKSYLNRLIEGHSEAQKVLNLYNRYIKMHNSRSSTKSKLIKSTSIIKLLVKGLLNRDGLWKEKIQLKTGYFIKINSDLYKITKVHKQLKKKILFDSVLIDQKN